MLKLISDVKVIWQLDSHQVASKYGQLGWTASFALYRYWFTNDFGISFWGMHITQQPTPTHTCIIICTSMYKCTHVISQQFCLNFFLPNEPNGLWKDLFPCTWSQANILQFFVAIYYSQGLALH